MLGFFSSDFVAIQSVCVGIQLTALSAFITAAIEVVANQKKNSLKTEILKYSYFCSYWHVLLTNKKT